jgi:hypothetical protein
MTLPSKLAVYSVRPSGLKTAARTEAEWPSSVSRRNRVRTFQMATVPSSDPVASILPSGLKLAVSMLPPAWPESVVSSQVRRSSRVTLPSSCPKAACSAAGDRAAAPPSGSVRARFNVRASRSTDVRLPVETSRKRPSPV